MSYYCTPIDQNGVSTAHAYGCIGNCEEQGYLITADCGIYRESVNFVNCLTTRQQDKSDVGGGGARFLYLKMKTKKLKGYITYFMVVVMGLPWFWVISLTYGGSGSGYILTEKFPDKICSGRNHYHGQYQVFSPKPIFDYFSSNFFSSIFVFFTFVC